MKKILFTALLAVATLLIYAQQPVPFGDDNTASLEKYEITANDNNCIVAKVILAKEPSDIVRIVLAVTSESGHSFVYPVTVPKGVAKGTFEICDQGNAIAVEKGKKYKLELMRVK